MDITWGVLITKCNAIPSHLRFKDSDDVQVEEIGDGNLNFVVRVYNKDGRSVIVKHSLPFIKCLGEGYPLSQERIDAEYAALTKFHQLCPGSVPQPYAFDKPNNAVFMEDLKGYQLLRNLLIDGQFDFKHAENLGRSLGLVHQQTHVGTIGETGVKDLYSHLQNSVMTNVTKEYVFERPFNKDEETNRSSPEVSKNLHTIYEDEEVLSVAKQMSKIFTEKKECLIHGDLHAGSVMVKDSDTRMFDLEFCSVGSAAYDLGIFITSFIYTYYRHMSIEEDNDTHRAFAFKMIDGCKTFVSSYLKHMTASCGDRDTYVNNLLSETAGFTACEIIRRTIGAAHLPYLEGLPLAEVDCLGAGIRLMKAKDKIHDIDKLLVIALMLIY